MDSNFTSTFNLKVFEFNWTTVVSTRDMGGTAVIIWAHERFINFGSLSFCWSVWVRWHSRLDANLILRQDSSVISPSCTLLYHRVSPNSSQRQFSCPAWTTPLPTLKAFHFALFLRLSYLQLLFEANWKKKDLPLSLCRHILYPLLLISLLRLSTLFTSRQDDYHSASWCRGLRCTFHSYYILLYNTNLCSLCLLPHRKFWSDPLAPRWTTPTSVLFASYPFVDPWFILTLPSRCAPRAPHLPTLPSDLNFFP